MLGALCQASHQKSKDTEGKEDADGAGPKVADTDRITADDVNKPQGWTVSIGYRFQPSSRHFVGSVEQKQREIAHNQVQNVIHLFDFSVERQISRRWHSISAFPSRTSIATRAAASTAPRASAI